MVEAMAHLYPFIDDKHDDLYQKYGGFTRNGGSFHKKLFNNQMVNSYIHYIHYPLVN